MPLSLRISVGRPRLNTNLLSAAKNAYVVRLVTISKWTALVVKHTKVQCRLSPELASGCVHERAGVIDARHSEWWRWCDPGCWQLSHPLSFHSGSCHPAGDAMTTDGYSQASGTQDMESGTCMRKEKCRATVA